MQPNFNTPKRVNASILSLDGLPLFRWSALRPTNPLSLETVPRAARRIAQRFGIPPQRARLVAELAGFQLEAEHV